MIAEKLFTAGSFATEPDAWSHFDELVGVNGAFKIHREVRGEYIHPRFNTQDRDAKVDRLLIPMKPALDAGWRLGAIAIEGKKSGHDLGPMISQALDYSRCAWKLTEGNPGLVVMTEWVFVYPVSHPTGTVESIMAQNRIGWCMSDHRRVIFASGATYGLILNDDKSVAVKALPMGRKRGSR